LEFFSDSYWSSALSHSYDICIEFRDHTDSVTNFKERNAREMENNISELHIKREITIRTRAAVECYAVFDDR
jgi:hypothetical protein